MSPSRTTARPTRRAKGTKKAAAPKASAAAPASVDAYIASFPDEIRVRLKAVRAAVLTAVPDGEERISYRMPAIFQNGVVAYYAAFKSSSFPGDFLFQISVFILCMVVLGGMGNVWGVIIGAAFLAYLDFAGLGNTGAWLNANVHFIGNMQLPGQDQKGLDVPLFKPGIYGLLILIVMLFRPEGLLPSRRVAAELHEGVHDQPLYDSTHTGRQR